MAMLSNSEVLTEDTFQVLSPVDGSVIAEFRELTVSEVDEAVQRARAAFPLWRDMPVRERAKLLWRFADLIEQNHEELARLDSLSMGKAIRDSLVEARRAADDARFWAGAADKVFGRELADVKGRLTYTRHEPLGVYGVITPWNAPTISFVNRSVPALAAGNAVVIKPSELSPLSAMRLAELVAESGMPEGIVQVITGSGAVGDMLVRHPDVGGISFTGSVATGAKISVAAAPTFKKVTLELGGKSPIVVFDDADLSSAAVSAVVGISFNAGQICSAGTRLVVHEDVRDKVIALMTEAVKKVRVGDPMDPATHMGPVSCLRQFEKVRGFIDRSVKAGEVVLGGNRPDYLPGDEGFFIEPTIITEVGRDSEVFQEEIFGPVITVTTFRTEEEAIEIANDTKFGLSSYVWTKDLGRMFRMVDAIDAGVVQGNTPQVMSAAFPFTGHKHSGFGTAYGLDAVEGFTQIKRVTLDVTGEPAPLPWADL